MLKNSSNNSIIQIYFKKINPKLDPKSITKKNLKKLFKQKGIYLTILKLPKLPSKWKSPERVSPLKKIYQLKIILHK